MLQLHAARLLLWTIWGVQSVRRTVQMSTWVGWYRLFDTSYVPQPLSACRRALTRKSPLECDSLADGEHRRPRDGNTPCECKDGWDGINCNGNSPPLGVCLEIF